MEQPEYYYNPPSEPSEEEEDLCKMSNFEFGFDGVLLSVVCVFGIIGNIFTLIVLSRPQMKSSINHYFKHLAVYDLLFLICKMLLHVVYVFAYLCDVKVMQDIYMALYPLPLYLIGVLTYIVRMGSVWTTVGVSVERYIVVCHPLKAITFCSYKKTVLANLLICILVICYNIPQFFVDEVTYVFNNYTNESSPHLTATAFGESYFYLDVYETWMNTVVNSAIPFLLLFFLNISIYRAVKKTRRDAQVVTQKLKAEIRLSFLLFSIVLIFLICYTPSFFFGIASSAGFSEKLSEKLPTLLHFTEAINSSVNFIVYCTVGRDFRVMVLHLFFRRKNQTRHSS